MSTPTTTPLPTDRCARCSRMRSEHEFGVRCPHGWTPGAVWLARPHPHPHGWDVVEPGPEQGAEGSPPSYAGDYHDDCVFGDERA